MSDSFARRLYNDCGMELSVRGMRVVERLGLASRDDVAGLPDWVFLKQPNCGQKTLAEIRSWVAYDETKGRDS